MAYKLTTGNVIQRISDGAWIPADPANIDWQDYLQWLEDGNAPEPAGLPDQNAAIQSQIDALERESMLNRGSRELQLFLMEERAAQVAAARGIPVAAILSANIYYSKLKPLDDQIAALREKIK